MKLLRSGVIVNTENFPACDHFYGETLELRKTYAEDDGEFKLCCFDLHGAYLMIETGGVAQPGIKTMQQSATKLRLNVADIEETLAWLESKGIQAAVQRNNWGSTIDIADPDGNRLPMRDETTFDAQLAGFSA